MTEIHGTCADEWAPVRDRFLANFDEGLEQGASVVVSKDGAPVVDLWAGDADGHGRPWEEDTLVNVYSTTKTMAATVMLMLIDRGEIDPDAPVATYWPEFKANGKEGVLIRHVLSHSAGLPGWDPPITAAILYDEADAADRLATQATWWEPGTKSGYHALTQGSLEWGIVQRVTGRTIGTFFREEVAEPLGADFHIGLPASENHRVADLVPAGRGLDGSDTSDPNSIAARTLLSCPLDALEPRTREWRGAEIPAAGGQGNARSVARVHAALANGGAVDGVRLMREDTVERVLETQTHGVDEVLGLPMRYGLGFGLMSESTPLSITDRAFFWGGWGGSVALVDLENRLTVSYAMNRMGDALVGDMRGVNLIFTAYAALADQA
ncbi:MAG TPA: serine hydrolase domain-containing protein [Acidimicrobiales bacterium]